MNRNAPLPKAPPAKCPCCSAILAEQAIRPISAIPAKLRTTAIGCLAQCAKCGQRLVGVRTFARLFAGNLKFLRQSFDRYTAENHAGLLALQEYLTLGEQGGDVHLQNLPEQPQLVVWFEDTRGDAERAAPGLPAPGLIDQALPVVDGVTVDETRAADGPFLAGVRVTATSAAAAMAFANAVRRAARQHGTAAYVRQYAGDFMVRWDVGAANPGTSEFIERFQAAA